MYIRTKEVNFKAKDFFSIQFIIWSSWKTVHWSGQVHHDKPYTVEDEKKVDKEIEELERKIKAVSTGVTESIKVCTL